MPPVRVLNVVATDYTGRHSFHVVKGRGRTVRVAITKDGALDPDEGRFVDLPRWDAVAIALKIIARSLRPW